LVGSAENSSPLQALLKGEHITYDLLSSSSESLKIKVAFGGGLSVSVQSSNGTVNSTTEWKGAAGYTVNGTRADNADYQEPNFDLDSGVKKFVDDELAECKHN